ncbi:MAG TPA: terminase large subunit [Rhizobiaceae bacterium]|nr:terminase large subunit [Rhizobiaceae bacterium]
MRTWSTACRDWQERIVNRRSLIPIEPLFPDEAEAALEVFKSLRIVDVAGQPTFGEACEDYVFDFVRAVFGAYDPETGQRLIEEFFLLISKKNIKSTLAAGIMLTALVRNWRQANELLILAPTREVADNSFTPAANMVKADPELDALLHVQHNTKEITHRLNKSVLKVVSADSSSAAGKKAAFVLVEELWLFGKKAGAGPMLQEATGGLISRPEGFVIYISTQSDAPPVGVFKEKLDYFRNVRDGIIDDPRSLPVLYEFPDDMIEDRSYLDPANFYITNPNMGRSVRQEWLERKLAKVRAGDDEEGDTIQTFLAKHLNVEIGHNTRANRWPGADFWASRADKKITLDYILENCEVIVPGIDGGGLDDLFGLAVLGRHKETKDWLCWAHAWCHNGVLERRKSIASALLDFKKAGELTIVDDRLDDISEIVDIIDRIHKSGLLYAVAVDPAGIGEMIDAMGEIGLVLNETIIGAQQGYRMMDSIKTAERRLANGTLRHSGSSLMAWCVTNLKIEPTATAIRATKQTAGDAKIDPVMAMFNAVMLMSRNPEAKGASVYETRGLLMVG